MASFGLYRHVNRFARFGKQFYFKSELPLPSEHIKGRTTSPSTQGVTNTIARFVRTPSAKK
jgi:hypothetical protein